MFLKIQKAVFLWFPLFAEKNRKLASLLFPEIKEDKRTPFSAAMLLAI
jgi:hypothetical protein